MEAWEREMDMPLPGAARARPTEREEHLEAAGFMALYAQVQAQ